MSATASTPCWTCDGLGYHAATLNRQPCSICMGSGAVPDLLAALEQSIERARAARRSGSQDGAS